MEKWTGKIAVVTGASEGIGRNLITQLVKHGVIVFGLARSKNRIEELGLELINEKGKLIAQKCNLMNLKRISEIFEHIEDNYGGISIIVNMASTASGEDLIESDIEAMEYTLILNVLAPAYICKLGIKSMRKHNIDGHIINVGGTAGYFTSVMPDYHFYSVSKFILRAFGDGLRMEFRANNINIRISNIGPGHVLAGSQGRAGVKGSEIYEFFKLVATEVFNVKQKAIPKNPAVTFNGEEMYTKNLLPYLEMRDVTDCIIQMLASPQGCEVMDMIVKPTDRHNNIFEADTYTRS